MSALMYTQTSQTHRGKFTCLRCLCHFTEARTLSAHIPGCLAVHDGECRVRMPCEGDILIFENQHKRHRVDYVVYSDFESVMDKTTGVHTPCGYATLLVDSTGKPLKFDLYRGEDCMDRFFVEYRIFYRGNSKTQARYNARRRT